MLTRTGKSYDLYLFDLDGTLIEGHVSRPDPKGPFVEVHPFSEVHVLPGRRAKLEALLDAGARLGICTNKAGVAFGHSTVEECREKAQLCCEKLGLVAREGTVSWTECYDHPDGKIELYRVDSFYRKPAPGMILKSLIFHEVDPSRTLFVGDMDCDREAAARAGVDYMDVGDFFLNE